MSETPDFRGQAERNKPTDRLHGLMNKIPGYTGYADKERRRDADKMLRSYLARQYRDQLTRLTHLQTAALHTRHSSDLGELQRLEGKLNRFIDKLDTASYGYAGLFDANKVTEVELDQLYAFDQGLMNGVHSVSSDLDALEAAMRPGTDAPAPDSTAAAAAPPDSGEAMTKLGTTIDTLLQTWGHRNDVLTSGAPLPAQEFDRFRTTQDAPGTPTGPLDAHQAAPPPTGDMGTAPSPAGNTGAGLGNVATSPGSAPEQPRLTMPPTGDSGATQRLGPLPGSDPLSATPSAMHAIGDSGTAPAAPADTAAAMPGSTSNSTPPATDTENASPSDSSVPSGAEGGSLGGGDLGTNRPFVGGGESAGSPAARAGADPHAVTSYEDPGAPAVGPEADDGTHSTLGGQPGSGSGSGQ